jgi:hypothetical protein
MARVGVAGGHGPKRGIRVVESAGVGEEAEQRGVGERGRHVMVVVGVGLVLTRKVHSTQTHSKPNKAGFTRAESEKRTSQFFLKINKR